MDRNDLKELHFITPIANLSSIARHGVVCNRYSKSMGAVSIALEEVRRNGRISASRAA
jgi:hypothetical protein